MREIELLDHLNPGHRRVLEELAAQTRVYTIRQDENVANMHSTTRGALARREVTTFEDSEIHRGNDGLHVKPEEVSVLLHEGLVAHHRLAPRAVNFEDLGRLGYLKLTSAGRRLAALVEEAQKP